METSIALVVLGAALFHATWNALVKSGKDHLLSITGINFATLVIAVLALPFFGIPDKESWPYLLVSGVIHFGYYVALSEAYKHGDFSQAYPVARGTAPILVSLWGVFVLNESMNTIELVSLIGVITGILIFATRKLDQVIQNKVALISALCTSFFIAGYTVTDGVGGRLSGNVPGYMLALSVIDGMLIMAYTAIVRSPAAVWDTRKSWRTLVPGAVLSLAAYTMVVWAMTRAPIPLVSALRETSIIIAALIGAFYFKEPSGKRRIIASVVIFISVAILGFDSG
jgi:drug/metabolite transporter (DMT)-like permease